MHLVTVSLIFSFSFKIYSEGARLYFLVQQADISVHTIIHHRKINSQSKAQKSSTVLSAPHRPRSQWNCCFPTISPRMHKIDSKLDSGATHLAMLSMSSCCSGRISGTRFFKCRESEAVVKTRAASSDLHVLLDEQAHT